MADDATTTTDAPADQTSADSATDTTTTTDDAESATDDGTAALGDAGKKALDTMKGKWKDAERLAKETADKLAAIEAKLNGKEAEHAAALEAKRVQDEALAKANERIVGAELRAAAKGKVAEDVLADLSLFIKPSDFEVGDDGSVDADAIARAIDDLISNKPSLAAQGSRFQGSADGGARKDASQPAQLSEADMARMTPEQKVDALEKGQFDRLLGRT